MLTKHGYYADGGSIQTISQEEALVDPAVALRMHKFAEDIRAIAPKSDDFLYFTIIFLRAAESALLDDEGKIKKIGSEDAWGFFDEKWKWHGNVPPHRNNNKDIFPESELKVAYAKWIGRPLCVDHKSNEVDGIRGIILDTHYDDKLKQVVGLCALDRVNYPQLAHKVEAGIVRFGSMGTAVEVSVCSECQHRATTQKEYCRHVINKQAWGEINVGLKPIEYSLVVQPAEPGARLLRCIASLQEYRDEFIDYGVGDVDGMLGALSYEQAEHLNKIMDSACGDGSCSIAQRRNIVTSFLKNNGLVKSAQVEKKAAMEKSDAESFAGALSRVQDATGYTVKEAIELGKGSPSYEAYMAIFEAYGLPMVGRDFQEGETVSSQEHAPRDRGSIRMEDDSGSPYYGDAATSLISGVTPEKHSFDEEGEGGVGPEHYVPETRYANTSQGDLHKTQKSLFQTIMEDLNMNEQRLRKRAEARRKLAYHFGGAEGVEPSGTYKDQGQEQNRIRDNDDKQMNQEFGAADAATGMQSADKPVKEKLSRAELEDRRLKRLAYYFGGAEGIEPSGTYKDQGQEQNRIRENDDKQMNQEFGAADAATGMQTADKPIKEKQSRASELPPLRTKFSQLRNVDGNFNKAGSVFEVYAGDKRVLSTTAGEIWGTELEENWDWMSSREYGKAVVAEIRDKGLEYVTALLKSAQLVPPTEGAPPEAAPEAAIPEMPEGEDLPPVDEGAEMVEETPKDDVEAELAKMEESIATVRDLLSEMAGGKDVDINIDVGEEGEEAPEKMALSRHVYKQLKTALADMSLSADELAMLGETFDEADTLPKGYKSKLNVLANNALKDAAEIRGEAAAIVNLAKVVSQSLVKTSEYVEEAPVEEKIVAEATEENEETVVEASEDAEEEAVLVAEAMEMRRQRREALLKQAEGMFPAPAESPVEDEADDAEVANPVEDVVNAIEDDVVDASDDNESEADDDESESEESESEESESEESESEAADPVVKAKLEESMLAKKAEEERESYRLKMRRAYDIAMEMQRKGMIPATRPALNQQVDEIMTFDDAAFESYKRAIEQAQPARTTKIATDLGGLNVGVEHTEEHVKNASAGSLANQLSSLWDDE